MRACALAVAMVLCAAPSAEAAGWKVVTTPDQASIDQVGLLRTSDGVLHLAWHHPTGPNTDDLLHTVIARNGKLGATNPISHRLDRLPERRPGADPQGMRAFVGAIRTTDPADPQDELNTMLSRDGGASWELQMGNVVPDGGQAYGSPVAATTLPSGVSLQTWAGTLGTWVHAGLSPSTPNHDFQAPLGTYGYDPNLATDASGRTVMAWYSSATGHLGVRAQDVAADGSPVGSATTMPGTSDMQVGMSGLTPIVARPGGGSYVAYPTGLPGDGPRAPVARGRRKRPADRAPPRHRQLARDDRRRLGRPALGGLGRQPGWCAARARAALEPNRLEFGATVDAGRPRGSPAAYRLGASPIGGALDVLANFNVRTEPRSATYHRRILPGLTLKASPAPAAPGSAAGRALRRERRRRSRARRACEGWRRIRAHGLGRKRDAATPGASPHRTCHEERQTPHRGCRASRTPGHRTTSVPCCVRQ